MILEILVKTAYNKQMFYPVCNNAIIFARIAKAKTLTRTNLAYIKDLGFEIEYRVIINEVPVKIEIN